MILPHQYVEKVTDLNPTVLRDEGLEGLLLDIDGTLKDYGTTEYPPEVLDWIVKVREAGLSICLFSNGRIDKVRASAAILDAPWVAKAYKPSPLKCRKGLAELGMTADQVALIGDQIFADVLSGRLAGIRTILVEPTSWVEPWFTKLKRPFEIPLRRMLRRSLASAKKTEQA